MSKGWLVNDYLTCIENTKTFWHDLLEWIPNLEDKTGVPFHSLPNYIEQEASINPPDYIIRNATYFPWLNLNIPTISLLQDIADNPTQREVLELSDTVVVNSEYTLSRYSNLNNTRIVPLGTNFNLFRPLGNTDALRQKWGIAKDSVVFVGAQTEIKGWSFMATLVESAPDLNFVFVMKDTSEVRFNSNNYRAFHRVGHQDLVEILNCCSIGICTSITETQHLAGIEMGACGLPIVTSNVGAYYNREKGDWGCRYTNPIEDIKRLISLQLNPRKYWLEHGFDLESCKRSWIEIIHNVESKNP